jgi:protein O-mannosyl-transferase
MRRPALNLLFGFVLFGATLLTYWPALHAAFIWNDADYVTAPELRSLHGLSRIWFEVGATEQYYPLLHSAFWVQHKLWGDWATGYHVFNILLHASCACLLAATLRELGFTLTARWLAAFIFALHPVCVESVAWISEQKNTQSLLIYLGAALLYLRFDRGRSPRVYVAATLVFLAALLTKSVTATLPPALLVVFWWRRGRIDWRRDVMPLVPWFIAAATMGLFSAWVEKNYIGAQGSDFALTLGQRGLLAGRIAWFYAAKLLWPAGLVFIYPRWTIDPTEVWQWLFSLGALALLFSLWALRRRSRAPLAAALFFGGALFPTLGFFNVYAFLFSYVADHWQYLPAIGLIVLGAGAVERAVGGIPAVARTAVFSAILLPLALISFDQAKTYRDLHTFYSVTVARNPEAWMAHNNLGTLLRERGELEAARQHLEAALRVRPDLSKTHNNLGSVLRDLRRPVEAVAHYRRAVELQPDYMEAHNNLGSLLRMQGDAQAALRHLLRAVQLDPQSADARNNLGMTLRDLGRHDEAIAEFQRALRLTPDMAPAHLNLALSLSLLGRNAEAMQHYAEARRLNPAIPELPARP